MRYRALGLFAALSPAIANAQGAETLIELSPVVQTPAGSPAWRIRYWTTDDRSRPAWVTGFVIAPREARPPRPRNGLA